jgi:hypothetical protein
LYTLQRIVCEFTPLVIGRQWIMRAREMDFCRLSLHQPELTTLQKRRPISQFDGLICLLAGRIQTGLSRSTTKPVFGHLKVTEPYGSTGSHSAEQEITMRLLRLLTTILLILCAAASAFAATPTVTAVKTGTAPVLDGKLDDAVWQQGEWYNNFTLLSEGMKDEAYTTAKGIYTPVYETLGYWFRTPEAWDEDGTFRASMYMRPGAIWSMEMVK